MMEELRRLWFMLDSNNIHIKPRHIKPTANTWEDKFSRHLDTDDWQLDPTVFLATSNQFWPHPIDRFASALIALLPCYNANRIDPSREAVNALHLSDAHWCDENN
jgi:hypothetical protein